MAVVMIGNCTVTEDELLVRLRLKDCFASSCIRFLNTVSCLQLTAHLECISSLFPADEIISCGHCMRYCKHDVESMHK